MKKMIRSMLLCLLLSPLAVAASDVYYYSMQGEISQVSASAIALDDASYPFMPTVKVIGIDGKSTSASSLKPGDYVKVTILNMDKKRRVDKIEQMKKPE
ncbi:MAG: hypothetical protein QNJ69_12280 [Gammaproteobacteria bacterium]|nr:hypothetical protein [Gammaproteobacteria bacterium]